MRFSDLSALVVAGASAATVPLSSRQDCPPQPSTEDVTNAINNWNTDVNMVNMFLKKPSVAGAQNALTFASDEPDELNILATICGVTDEYTNAVSNLMHVFPGVLSNLMAIIMGGDIDSLVEGINNIRCCNVLPDLDILWTEAAEGYGIFGTVPATPACPDACASITC